MTPLASYILSLALNTYVPGQSGFSRIELPECGTDPHHALCSLARLCADVKDPACNPPAWTPCFHGWRRARLRKTDPKPMCHPLADEPGAWTRLERKDEGALRYEPIAEALAEVAEAHAGEWQGGAIDLARAVLAAAGSSTGLKKSIEDGTLRGPAGEVCLTDMQLPTLRTVVSPELAKLSDNDLAWAVAGEEHDHLVRCFDAGATLLIRVRHWSGQHCKRWPWDYAMFSAYAAGSRCDTIDMIGDASVRQKTYERFRSIAATSFPEWYAGPQS